MFSKLLTGQALFTHDFFIFQVCVKDVLYYFEEDGYCGFFKKQPDTVVMSEEGRLC